MVAGDVNLNFWFGRNNIIANITHNNNLVFWTTSKKLKFKGRLRTSKYASFEIVKIIIREFQKRFWRKRVTVRFFGMSWNYKKVLSILIRNRIKVKLFVNMNNPPHNGCRLRKRKRKKNKRKNYFQLSILTFSLSYFFDFVNKFFSFCFLSFESFFMFSPKKKKIVLLKAPFVNSKSKLIYYFTTQQCLLRFYFIDSAYLRFYFLQWFKKLNLKLINTKLRIKNYSTSYKF